MPNKSSLGDQKGNSRHFNLRSCFFRYGLAAFFCGGIAFGAEGDMSEAGELENDFRDLMAKRQEMMRQYQEIRKNGGSEADILEWRKKNFELIELERDRRAETIREMGAEPFPLMPAPQIPEDATPALRELLEKRVMLRNNRNSAMNAAGAMSPNEASSALKKWYDENSAEFAALRELSRKVAEEAAREPIPSPPPLQIPSGTPPEMEAYLTGRHQLLKDRVEFLNSQRGATPEQQQAAIRKWQMIFRERLAALRQKAPNSPNSPTLERNP